ncbi:hypothetical protein [uncultured Thiohalocapsa sp.]|nr:hypothetical protein [uncultured Thiohalocapsa sp.]
MMAAVGESGMVLANNWHGRHGFFAVALIEAPPMRPNVNPYPRFLQLP